MKCQNNLLTDQGTFTIQIFSRKYVYSRTITFISFVAVNLDIVIGTNHSHFVAEDMAKELDQGWGYPVVQLVTHCEHHLLRLLDVSSLNTIKK